MIITLIVLKSLRNQKESVLLSPYFTVPCYISLKSAVLQKIIISHLGKYSTRGKNKFTTSINPEAPFISITVEELEACCSSFEMMN